MSTPSEQTSADRQYTAAQAAAVNRVRKCRVDDYYGILDIESPSNEAEIRKSYRKLALIMHPDKNTAPGADEAFKMISRAFQVLSDTDKKRMFDQGVDPETRGRPQASTSGFSSGSGFPFGGMSGMNGMNGMGGGMGGEISPEDLFNMFFGGGMGGGPGVQFGGFGPNIRVHTFGGGGSPFGFETRQRQTSTNQRTNQGNQTGANQGTDGEFSVRNLIQLLPIFILFGLPILMSMFGSEDSSSSSSASRTPQFKFAPQPPYTVERKTPVHDISYYTNPRDTKDLSDKRLGQLDRRAEQSYISTMKTRCYREYEHKQQALSDAQGWLFTDTEAYDQALRMPLEACETLDRLGVVYMR